MRPPVWQVALLSAICLGLVVSFAFGAFGIAWPLWLAAFLLIEVSAAANREPGDTLSERTWRWLGIRPPHALRWPRTAAIAVFLVELTLHFMFGGAYPWCGGLAIILTALPVGAVVVYSLVLEGGFREDS